MTLRNEYATFLQGRLRSRIEDLRTALAPLVQDPPAPGHWIEIELHPGDGLKEAPPIAIHVYGPDHVQVLHDGAARSNDLLWAMSPLLAEDEEDGFLIWESEGEDRMVALHQPIDGIDEAMLKAWVREAWLGLDTTGFERRVVLAVHDSPDAHIVLEPPGS